MRGITVMSVVEAFRCVCKMKQMKVKYVKTQLDLLDVNERHVSAYLAIIRLQSSMRLCVLWRMLRSHHIRHISCKNKNHRITKT